MTLTMSTHQEPLSHLVKPKVFLFLACLACLLFVFTTTTTASPYVYRSHDDVPPPPAQQMMIDGVMVDVVDPEEAFFQYVAAEDKNFQWNWNETSYREDVANQMEYWMIEYTSQKWLDETIIANNRSYWQHEMIIAKPTGVELVHTNKALVYLTGGSAGADMWTRAGDFQRVTAWAKASRMIAVMIFRIPSTKMTYVEDATQLDRVEDEFVAYSWASFLKNPTRPDFIGFFPQVKAAIRGLDVIEQASLELYKQKKLTSPIEFFIVSGESKRGHTTWGVGSFEGRRYLPESGQTPRVLGIAPTVYDALDLVHTIMIQARSLGNWSFALKDYHDNHVPDYFASDEIQWLRTIMDPVLPHFQRGLQQLPVLLTTTTGDPFFFPEGDRNFWPVLTGMANTTGPKGSNFWPVLTDAEKTAGPKYPNFHRYIVNNAEHNPTGNAASYFDAISSFVSGVVSGRVGLYNFWWTTNWETGELTLYSVQRPSALILSQAQTLPQWLPGGVLRRDFRQVQLKPQDVDCAAPRQPYGGVYCTNPVIWSEEQYPFAYDAKTKLYTATFTPTAPEQDNVWKGYYFMVRFGEFEDNKDMRQTFTTSAVVFPDTYPHPACQSVEDCHRTLV